MSGFFLENPAGLWALAALAAVVALYLFYRRFRPQPVTGLFLWGEPRRDGRGGRKIDSPNFGRSFWLDMLAAALFALALAGPAWRTVGLPVVVVLDDAFSMRAKDAHLEARRRAAAVLAAAPAGAVILAGDGASVLRGMGVAGRGEAEQLLASYLPSGGASDLQAGVSLARDLYGPELDIHVFTNRGGVALAAGDGGTGTLHTLTGRGGNLAVADVWRRRDPDRPGREILSLVVVNYAATATGAAITVETDAGVSGRVLVEEKMKLGAGQSGIQEFSLPAVGGETLLATIIGDGEDVIAEDSRVFVPPAPVRSVTYGFTGINPEAGRFVRLALEAAGSRPAAPGHVPDLLVTSLPNREGGVATLELTRQTRPGLVAPPFLVDYDNPLCRDIDLSGTLWAAASPDRQENVRDLFIGWGNLPLYWSSGPRRFHMNLLPDRGTLSYDAAWPVLLANLAARVATMLPGPDGTLYRPGETLRYTRPAGASSRLLRLFDNGREVASSSSGRGFALPRAAGLYRLRLEDDDAGEIAIAPLYGAMSDATGLAATPGASRLGGTDSGEEKGVFDLSWLTVLLGLAFLAINWRKETPCP